MNEPQDLQHESMEQLFDGNEISPQFALALKKFLAKQICFKAGFATITTNGAQQTFAHGLGIIPTIYGITPQIYTAGTNPVVNMALLAFDPAQAPDATNFYLKGLGENAAVKFAWFAAYVPTT